MRGQGGGGRCTNYTPTLDTRTFILKSTGKLCRWESCSSHRARSCVKVHPVFLGDHAPSHEVHPLGQARGPPRSRQRSRDALGGPPCHGLCSRLGCFLCGSCWIKRSVDLDRATGSLLNARSCRSCPCSARPSCYRYSEYRAATTVVADLLFHDIRRRVGLEDPGALTTIRVELGNEVCSDLGRGRSSGGEHAERASARGRDREQHEAQRHASPVR